MLRSFLVALLFAASTCLAADNPADSTLDLPVDKPPTKKTRPPVGPPEDTEDGRPHFYGQEIRSENATIFYVIDISGSMAYDLAEYVTPDGNVRTGSRLDRAKAELMRSVLSLPPNFKFDMLAYDCSSYVWQPDLVPANTPNKADAVRWTNALMPGGGTGTGPATALVLRTKNLKLAVLLTDGAPNCYLGGATGSLDDFDAHRRIIREANTNPAIVNVYGIGATGPFKQFCIDVASDNGGTYTDVR
jgi:hypothetical protein